MRLVCQRVSAAGVSIDGEIVSQIGKGLLILIGVGQQDGEDEARRVAEKVSKLRIFADDQDKMNLSVSEVRGEILVVSQFTLYGDVKKGNRPSFVGAAAPEVAHELIQLFVQELEDRGIHVSQGRFGAMMQVSLVNDGPVTILMD